MVLIYVYTNTSCPWPVSTVITKLHPGCYITKIEMLYTYKKQRWEKVLLPVFAKSIADRREAFNSSFLLHFPLFHSIFLSFFFVFPFYPSSPFLMYFFVFSFFPFSPFLFYFSPPPLFPLSSFSRTCISLFSFLSLHSHFIRYLKIFSLFLLHLSSHEEKGEEK